jgi:hypothetical protein
MQLQQLPKNNREGKNMIFRKPKFNRQISLLVDRIDEMEKRLQEIEFQHPTIIPRDNGFYAYPYHTGGK